MLSLTMPVILGEDAEALVEVCYVGLGDDLGPGHKLLDISIDLSARFNQNCPPISYYRIVSRERARVVKLLVPPGGLCAPGEVVALCATDRDDGVDGPVGRSLRVTTAGILGHDRMWSAGS